MSPEAIAAAVESLQLRVQGAELSLQQAEDSEQRAGELLERSVKLREEAAGRLNAAREALEGIQALQEPESGADGVPEGDSSEPDEFHRAMPYTAALHDGFVADGQLEQ